jgi:hemerythrin
MTHVECPAAAANKQAHREFVARLDGWLVKLRSGVSLPLVLEVHREISKWIGAHIVSVDCKLRGCRLN